MYTAAASNSITKKIHAHMAVIFVVQ